MSRKFLDQHIEEKVYSPVSGTAILTGYDGGHLMLNAIDGTRYVNEGDRSAAIFGHFPGNRFELIERFKQPPALNAAIAVSTNLDWEVLGTNMTTALATQADGGGVTLTTAGASADQAILLPHLDTKQSSWTSTKWNTLDRVVFETTIKTGASIAAAIIWAGLKLTNTPVVATDDNQVMFRYEAGVASGVFQFITSRAGTDTTANSDVTVAAATKYHLKITIDGNRVPRFFINGVLKYTGAALTTNIDLIPYIGVQASAVAAKAITVRGVRMSKDQND